MGKRAGKGDTPTEREMDCRVRFLFVGIGRPLLQIPFRDIVFPLGDTTVPAVAFRPFSSVLLRDGFKERARRLVRTTTAVGSRALTSRNFLCGNILEFSNFIFWAFIFFKEDTWEIADKCALSLK